MACILPFKTAEANAKSWLRTQGIVDKYLNILDPVRFRQANRRMSEKALKKYGIKAQWFFEEQGGTKAVPNKEAFRKADQFNGINYKIYKQLSSPGTKHASDTFNKSLEGKLKSFLSQYGIGVTYVDSLRSRGYDAVAIADITNRMILISKDEADVTTLPEEVAHVAVELLGEGNPLIKRMMDIIEEAPIYQEVYDEYKNDPDYELNGKPDTKKIKKEAIGKAISLQIVNRKKNKTFSGTISRIWGKVKGMFKRVDQVALNQEIDRIADRLASDIIDNKLEGSTENLTEGIFKQKTNKTTKERVAKDIKRAESALKTLQVREKQLKRSVLSSEDGQLRLKNSIAKVNAAIITNQAVAGVGFYMEEVEAEATKLLDTINAFKGGAQSLTLSSHIINDMYDFLTLNKTTLNDLISFFENDPEFKERGEGVLELASKLTQDLNAIESFANYVKKEKVKEIVEREKQTDFDPEEVIEFTEHDTSWGRMHLGSAKHAKDEVLRIVYNMVEKVKHRVDRYTINLGKDLTSLQVALEKKGFKDFGKFYERYTTGDNKGKKTGNLISKYNLGEYYKAQDKVRQNIAERMGYESYDDVPPTAQMNASQAVIYREEWRKFRDKESIMLKGGTSIPSKKYLNPEFAKLSKEEKQYYNKLMEIKEEAMSKLPVNYRTGRNTYLMPQVRKDWLDRLKSKEQGIFKNLKEISAESVIIKEDETDFGSKEIIVNPITGEIVKMLPIHYNHRLENMDNLSDDISAIYIAYANMAEKFHQKSQVTSDLSLLEKQIGERQYRGDKEVKKGIETNTYKMLNNFLDTYLYENIKNKGAEVKFGNKKVNFTKISDGFNRYVRRNNLALNAFTHIANYSVGSVYSKIEDAAGVYTTSESKRWAEGELDKNLPHIMMQAGKRLKTNKVALLYEYNGISKSALNAFQDLNAKSQATRILFDSGVYATYEIGDYRVKGKIMLAVYDNYRLHKGKYVTRDQFRKLHENRSKSEVAKMWRGLKDETLYKAYEVKGNKVQVKKEYQKYVTEDIINKVNNRVNQVGDQVDGRLSEMDRGNIHRNSWGRLIMTHRGWLIAGFENRWKHTGFNYSTGEMEEGYHRTFFNNVILGLVRNKFNFVQAVKNYGSLSDLEQRNLKKAWGDVVFILGAAMLAGFINGMADDDEDNYSLQFAAYMTTRVQLEAWAFSNPFEVMGILESPAAGVNQVESVLDALKMFTTMSDDGTLKAFEEVDRGVYEGHSRFEKFLLKRSYAKNFYEFYAAEEKNRYLKQLIL